MITCWLSSRAVRAQVHMPGTSDSVRLLAPYCVDTDLVESTPGKQKSIWAKSWILLGVILMLSDSGI